MAAIHNVSGGVFLIVSEGNYDDVGAQAFRPELPLLRGFIKELVDVFAAGLLTKRMGAPPRPPAVQGQSLDGSYRLEELFRMSCYVYGVHDGRLPAGSKDQRRAGAYAANLRSQHFHGRFSFRICLRSLAISAHVIHST
jgi:hypothetical protein